MEVKLLREKMNQKYAIKLRKRYEVNFVYLEINF